MDLKHTILDDHRAARLEPFTDRHRSDLIKAAEADRSIFEHTSFGVVEHGYAPYFWWLRSEQAAGRWMPYVVIAPDEQVVGQTCYLTIRAKDAGVEIGGTWYRSDFQGTSINPASKLLMIEHAFACGAERVEFKADSNNTRSRAALLKLGASFEGIRRRCVRRLDGSWRDTACFSIIRPEWASIRGRIEERLSKLN